MNMRNLPLRSCALTLLLPAVLWAGKITLKDGTVYTGTVKKLGSSYTVKLDDGMMKIVSQADVATVDDPTLGGGGGATGVKPAGGAAATPGNASDDFARTSRQADRIDTPLLGVALWQKFVETHPKDAAAAAELKKWKAMANDGAEKVKGKWIVGEELKKFRKDINARTKTAIGMIHGDQTTQGIKMLEEILKDYPNSFPANFEMGYFSLKKIVRVEGSNKLMDDSIKSLETAVKLRPTSAEALTNLAIAYNFRRRFEESVLSAYKAAQIDDSKEIVQNLYNALDNAPAGMLKNNPKVVPILSDANVLFSKRGAAKGQGWTYVWADASRSHKGGEASPGESERKGLIGTGTGFFVTADGYLMTNRHVAAAGDKLMVVFSDGTTKVAQKVVVDDDQDIAILKVDVGKTPAPFIRLADADEPNVGTDVTVMGFPLGAAMGMHVKITRGVVTSIEADKEACDVIVDAQVNPGNSGGPMLDKYGNLMALVAMKTMSDEAVSSYGLGISTGRLRKFFEHQKDKLSPVKFVKADKTVPTAALSTEDIAGKFTKATVMVLIFNGELPADLK